MIAYHSEDGKGDVLLRAQIEVARFGLYVTAIQQCNVLSIAVMSILVLSAIKE